MEEVPQEVDSQQEEEVAVVVPEVVSQDEVPQVAEVPLEVEEAVAVPEVEEEVPRLLPRSSLNPIVMKVFLSLEEKKTCCVPKTWSLVNLCMVKRESASTTQTEQRLNIVSGILSVPSWLPVSWVVLITFTLLLVKRYSISVLPVVHQSPTSQTLLDPLVLFMQLNFLIVPEEI